MADHAVIRPYATTDLPEIVSVYRRFEEKPWREVIRDGVAQSVIAKALAHPGGHVFVAEVNGAFAGFSVGYPLVHMPEVVQHVPGSRHEHEHMLYLADLVVTEERESNGVGLALIMERVRHFAKFTDTPRIDVVTRLSAANPKKHASYRALGMHAVAEVEVLNEKYIGADNSRDNTAMVADRRLIYQGMVNAEQ